MTTVQRNVQIKASPQETGALLSDARRWPEWYPGTTVVDVAAPFPEVGGKIALKVKQGGRSMSLTETVLEYEPGKLAVLQWSKFSGRERWELVPEGDGTRVTATVEYTVPGGVFGKIADALFVRRMSTKSLEEALQNVKALIERQ
jgi:uncharacterized protein YndB with AHSA1/START domain